MLSNLITRYMRAENQSTVLKSHDVFLNPSVNKNPPLLIYANPLFSPLLLICFSSIKLTILVTHDGTHYHDNVGNDGRGGEKNWRGGKNLYEAKFLMNT